MRTIGGTGDERTLNAQRTDDGGHLLVGYGQNPDSMNGDLLVLTVDRDGRLLRKQNFDGESQEQGKDIVRIDASRFLVAGGVQSFSEGLENDMLIRFLDDEELNERTGPDAAETFDQINDLMKIQRNFPVGGAGFLFDPGKHTAGSHPNTITAQ